MGWIPANHMLDCFRNRPGIAYRKILNALLLFLTATTSRILPIALIAAFQMYDWPEQQSRTDGFWTAMREALAAEGLDAPEALARPEDLSTPWRRPDLLIAQTCGLPYVSGECGSAILVARPSYDVAGALPGSYSSALICRAEDDRDLAGFLGARAAINETGSQSGCNALKDAFLQAGLADGPLFAEVVMSGAHRVSANLVSEGRADIAAIDAVAWALHGECDPESHARLRVLGWTRPMPALPFITAGTRADLIPVLTAALTTACAATTGTGLPSAILPAESGDYDPIRKMAHATTAIELC